MADSNESDELSAGTELPGGYTIEQPVVQGRTRLIYAARTVDGSLVAVHVLDAGLIDGLGEWFTQTATAREEITHPVLPRTLAVGRLGDGRPFEVTEFLDGPSMREALEVTPGGLDPLAVVHVVNEVAAALDALHARTPPVIVRTLCPEHTVALRDTHEVRLLGLFYADRPQFESVRPGYRSPEELAGVLSLGPRADVFSLATVAYELLTGRPAWPHVPELALDSMRVGVRDRVSVLRPVLPTALDAVFERAWSLSPDSRHSSAGRFAKALSAAVDPLDVAASMASNVFDDRPTAQVPTMLLRVRNNTLLNAGAVAQAIFPRPVAGAVRASESDGEMEGRSSRPPPPRMLRAPVPPGTRPVREEAEAPAAKIVLPRPGDIPAATDGEAPNEQDETPVATSTPSPEPTTATEVSPRGSHERPPPSLAEPPDEPTPLSSNIAQPSAVVVAPRVAEAPAPTLAPPVEAIAPPSPSPPAAPPVVRPPAPAPAPSYLSPLDSPPLERRPEAYDPRLLLDEPTTVINTSPALTPLWSRSPVALAGLFIAHALLIVGIAHAISYALVQRQTPTAVVIPGPSPVCSPCAACPSPVAVLPAEVSQALAPQGSPAGARGLRPSPYRPSGRTKIIRSVPDFGRPR